MSSIACASSSGAPAVLGGDVVQACDAMVARHDGLRRDPTLVDDTKAQLRRSEARARAGQRRSDVAGERRARHRVAQEAVRRVARQRCRRAAAAGIAGETVERRGNSVTVDTIAPRAAPARGAAGDLADRRQGERGRAKIRAA